MKLGRVCGRIVSTEKAERLTGYSILLVQPVNLFNFENEGIPYASLDSIGAGDGEIVMCVAGSSARQTDQTAATPVDDLIVAIIDSVEIHGRRIYDKAGNTLDREEKQNAVE